VKFSEERTIYRMSTVSDKFLESAITKDTYNDISTGPFVKTKNKC
jgi:hypothetical protein